MKFTEATKLHRKSGIPRISCTQHWTRPRVRLSFEDGHHRALACLALGFETIPANIIVVSEAYFSKYPIVLHGRPIPIDFL
jgi:hypothetical protein